MLVAVFQGYLDHKTRQMSETPTRQCSPKFILAVQTDRGVFNRITREPIKDGVLVDPRNLSSYRGEGDLDLPRDDEYAINLDNNPCNTFSYKGNCWHLLKIGSYRNRRRI